MPTKLKRSTIKLSINGSIIPLEKCARGYYLGELDVGGTPFHVEAIEVDTDGNAINDDYQNSIDHYSEYNEGIDYQGVPIGKKRYFVNIEAYAS